MITPIAAPKPHNPFVPAKGVRLPPAHNFSGNFRKVIPVQLSDTAFNAEVMYILGKMDPKKD